MSNCGFRDALDARKIYWYYVAITFPVLEMKFFIRSCKKPFAFISVQLHEALK